MRNSKILLFASFILGTIVPFVDYLVIIETFYLLIPFAILFIVSIVFILVQLIFVKQKNKRVLLLAFVMPILVLSQLIAGFTVDKIQRVRAEQLIKKIESKGITAVEDLPLGLLVSKDQHNDFFRISYSRGFMVREVYDSGSKTWTSEGWND